MDKFFDSIWVLRVTALILAVLLFFYVNNDDEDEKNNTTTSNTQVATIKDVPLEAYYDDENFIVSGLPKTVDVTIEGPMAIVIETKITKDFKAFVDLSKLLIGEHRVSVQTEGLSDKLEVSIDPKYLNITIEEKITKEFTVEPEINNQLIASGYVLESISAEPNTVKVTGAKSIIDSINYVKASVSGQNGINASFQQKANVKVLDGNLNRLDVYINPDTVNVKVNVIPYKREIPIKLNRTGEEKEGVKINSLTPKVKTVGVYGPKTLVDSLTELVVEFDVSKVDKSGEYQVNLKVPKGATKLSPQKIAVIADVTKEQQNEENEGQTEFEKEGLSEQEQEEVNQQTVNQ